MYTRAMLLMDKSAVLVIIFFVIGFSKSQDVDGGVSEWQEWGDAICDQTCGVNVNGTRTRLRKCDNPLRQGNGRTCGEQGITQQETSQIPCDQIPKSCGTPIDGSYGEWTEWQGECPTSCGINVRYVLRRNRTCDSPKPQNGGLNCHGSHSEGKTSPCQIPPCPDDIVNGTYGEWSSWVQDLCVDTCGVNVQTVLRRNRSCDNPAPQNGGLPCQGPSAEARQIDCEGVAPCPGDIVDGGYGEWSQWVGESCSNTCGVGVKVNVWRNRSCNSPAPQNGGLPCTGTNFESTHKECNLSPCPDEVVDGGYSEWGPWTPDPCPNTCGVKIRLTLNRYRRCDNPVPRLSGKDCEGSYFEQKTALCEGISPCPGQVVNGSFSEWSEWAEVSCPKTCGIDVETLQRRSRACDNPPPLNGGLQCDGSTSQERNGICKHLSPCPVDGGVSEWGAWDSPRCPTCGENVSGISLRLRPCDNPVPAHGGSFCIEPVQQTMVRSCDLGPCPVDGGMSSWTSWSIVPCPVTCGVDAMTSKTRRRDCNNPAPDADGKNCTGPLLKTIQTHCSVPPCQGDDKVSAWTTWSSALCTATCGQEHEGHRERTRTCIVPTNNITCAAALTDTQMGDCGLPKCLDVDGGVSEWQEWGDVICDQTCGVNVNGTRMRLRKCDNPLRQGNGRTCREQGITQHETSRIPCDQIPKSCGTAVNGSYGVWTEWQGVCATSCGINVRYVLRRNRSCDSPKPENGGLNCQGSHSEEKTSPCQIPPCPDDIVNGTYGEWSSWVQDLCVDTCGVNVQTVLRRNRSCDNPAPQNGGLPCQGPSAEARQIDCEGVAPCPEGIVDGEYGEWSQWTGQQCTKTCGVGVTVNVWRKRSCDSPAPQNGGLPCSGTSFESTDKQCNLSPCPVEVVDGGYSEWGQWTPDPCPNTCGMKIRLTLNRYRRCDNPVPRHNGKDCEGSYFEQKTALCEGISPCPGQVVNGSFSEWSEWAEVSCPKTCGIDVETLQRRSRACNKPPPLNGGLQCDGSTSQERNGICKHLSPCPVDGGVSEWGAWDSPRCPTCGENVIGISLRLRPCDNPVPAHGGSFCIEPVQQTMVRSCDFSLCPVAGNFTEWSEWDNPECPVTCGREALKVVSRNRSCTNPPLQFGGADCAGPSEESTNRSCNHAECPIDGEFTMWGEWNNPDCVVSCSINATKLVVRTRECVPPQFGGAMCQGSFNESEIRNCNLNPCPVDGGLSNWTSWSVVPCPVTCGVDAMTSQSRRRECNAPAPNAGGKNCTGPLMETSQTPCSVPECSGIQSSTHSLHRCCQIYATFAIVALAYLMDQQMGDTVFYVYG